MTNALYQSFHSVSPDRNELSFIRFFHAALAPQQNGTSSSALHAADSRTAERFGIAEAGGGMMGVAGASSEGGSGGVGIRKNRDPRNIADTISSK